MQALLIVAVVMLVAHWWDAKPKLPRPPRAPAGPLWWCGAAALVGILFVASVSMVVNHV